MVLEVGVVKVHESVLEGSGQHGTTLNSFLFKIAHVKLIKNRYLLLSDVLEVGVEDTLVNLDNPNLKGIASNSSKQTFHPFSCAILNMKLFLSLNPLGHPS